MRCTISEIPVTRAIARPVQCVDACGESVEQRARSTRLCHRFRSGVIVSSRFLSDAFMAVHIVWAQAAESHGAGPP